MVRCKKFLAGAGLGFTVLLGCGGDDLPSACLQVVDADIKAASTWADCTYRVKGDIEVSSDLTIKPGVVVLFDANASLKVEATGSLNAVGTADKRITFKGATETKGFWKGLSFRSNNPANALTYVSILHAGSEALCCDYFDGPGGSIPVIAALSAGGAAASGTPSVKVSSTTLGQSGGYGLYLLGKAKLPGFSGNLFTGNQKGPASVPLAAIGSLDSASVYSGVTTGVNEPNGEAFVRVAESPDSELAVTQTVHKLDVPYGVGASSGSEELQMEYRGVLTVEPGVRLQFEANTGLIFAQGGRLVADGTAADRIVFSGRVSTKGFWKGLSFRTSGNTLKYTTVSGAGGDDLCCDYFTGPGGSIPVKANISVGGAAETGTATVELSNSAITDSPNYGVFRFDNGSVTESGTTFSGNAVDKNY
jgi:hypothetical protein